MGDADQYLSVLIVPVHTPHYVVVMGTIYTRIQRSKSTNLSKLLALVSCINQEIHLF
jgi:hypothetical protein